MDSPLKDITLLQRGRAFNFPLIFEASQYFSIYGLCSPNCYTLLAVTALQQAVDCLHELHQLPVLDVFFCLLRLSERAYKGHTAFISSSSSFSLLMLDFLVDSYIVV